MARESGWRILRITLVPLLLLFALVGATACGGDPTATPTAPATATPTPVADEPGEPGPTTEPTPTPTSAPRAAPPTATATPAPVAESPRDLAEYFSGKTVALIAIFNPGGGSDMQARAFAQVAPKYTPGEPRFIVRNIPGGGGERGLRTGIARGSDGLTLTDTHARLILRPLSGDLIPDWDPLFPGLGDMGGQVATAGGLAVHSNVAGSWAEVLSSGKTITVSQDERGGSSGRGAIFAEAVGAPIKMIYGYSGSAEHRAAFARREVNGTGANCANLGQVYPEIFDDGVSLMFWWGREPEEGFDKTPTSMYTECQAFGMRNLDSAPHLWEITGANEDQKAMFRIADNIAKGRAVPPDTPDDILAMWRDVTKKVAEDPEYIRIMTAFGREVGYAPPSVFVDKYLAAKDAIAKNPSMLDVLRELVGG